MSTVEFALKMGFSEVTIYFTAIAETPEEL